MNLFLLLQTCECPNDKFLLTWNFLPGILSKQKQNHMVPLRAKSSIKCITIHIISFKGKK